MDNRKKKAWIYTRIDAPEDSHGTLKKQYEQLNTYGEQLRVEIAGSSSDMGESPMQSAGCAHAFHIRLAWPSTLPLHPVNPDNARPLRITAAAGT